MINRVADDLQRSPLKYRFSGDGGLPHLQLLSFVDRGRVRRSDGHVRLQRVPCHDLTIACLLGDNLRVRYAPNNHGRSIEGSLFALHLGEFIGMLALIVG